MTLICYTIFTPRFYWRNGVNGDYHNTENEGGENTLSR
nr:MAG TPA: hypothetical protein [Caudoviricetes sp.]